jgi:chromosomal replication initiator protein
MESTGTELHRELWEALREGLRRRFGEDLFERWIAGLSILSLEGDEICLGVANRFVQDWIQAKYLAGIACVIRETIGREVRLRLAIDPKLFQECRHEQRAVFPDRREAGLEGLPSFSPPSGAARALREAPRDRDGDAGDFTFANLVRGSCNHLAYSAALEVTDAPGRSYNPLFIFGSAGVGKTHLLKAIHAKLRAACPKGGGGRPGATLLRSQRPAGSANGAGAQEGEGSRIRYVTAERFFNHFAASLQDGSVASFRERYRALDVLIMDDVHLLVTKKKTQVEFLHTFNTLIEAGKQIVLASALPPKSLVELDQGLVGRFLSGLVVRIKKPDYETRLKIAVVHAPRFESRFDRKVLEFLAEQLRGNVRELIGAMMQLDIHSRVKDSVLAVEEAQDVLADCLREQQGRIHAKSIHHAVASHYGLEPEALISSSRQRDVSLARQVAMYLVRRYTRKSLAETGKYFGNRNHTTVRCAEIKIGKLLQTPQCPMAQDVLAIIEKIED